MIQAFYSGSVGLRARQTAMDTIANDIANVNTAGYVQKDTQFSDLLYNSMLRPANPAYNDERQGSGAAANAEAPDMSAGAYVPTDSPTDFAPMGDGFFAVQDAGGNVFYTRSGTFAVQNTANGPILADEQGRTVLGANGTAIPVQDGVPQAQPAVFTFANPQGLGWAGDTLFTANALSGAAQVSNEGVRAGAYTGSNVDLPQQMTRMIVTQRGFQLDARTVSTADQIESMVNDLH